MSTEAFIREKAAQGWSRAMVAEHLGINLKKMRVIEGALPDVSWPARNMSVRRQAYYDSIRIGDRRHG